MSYDIKQLHVILEGAILAAGEPLTIDRMLSLFEEHEAPSKDEIKEALESLKQSCEERGFKLTEVASGFRFQVREDLAEWVNRLWEEKPQKYSRAMLETLALIAYRQPITRGDIEEVRGVAVSSHIIKTLSERDWVKVVGHRDVPGRPALYATTRLFLDYFNLKSLDELPTLGELRDIDSLNESLEFDSLPPEVQESITAAAEAAKNAEDAEAQNLAEGEPDTKTPEEGENKADDATEPDAENEAAGVDASESTAEPHELNLNDEPANHPAIDGEQTENEATEDENTESNASEENEPAIESASLNETDVNPPSRDSLFASETVDLSSEEQDSSENETTDNDQEADKDNLHD